MTLYSKALAGSLHLSASVSSLPDYRYPYVEWVGGIHDSITLTWYLSADGGNNWEEVTSGVNHVFTNFGSDLRWKVSITNDDNYSTPYIRGLKVKFG